MLHIEELDDRVAACTKKRGDSLPNKRDNPIADDNDENSSDRPPTPLQDFRYDYSAKDEEELRDALERQKQINAMRLANPSGGDNGGYGGYSSGGFTGTEPIYMIQSAASRSIESKRYEWTRSLKRARRYSFTILPLQLLWVGVTVATIFFYRVDSDPTKTHGAIGFGLFAALDFVAIFMLTLFSSLFMMDKGMREHVFGPIAPIFITALLMCAGLGASSAAFHFGSVYFAADNINSKPTMLAECMQTGKPPSGPYPVGLVFDRDQLSQWTVGTRTETVFQMRRRAKSKATYNATIVTYLNLTYRGAAGSGRYPTGCGPGLAGTRVPDASTNSTLDLPPTVAFVVSGWNMDTVVADVRRVLTPTGAPPTGFITSSGSRNALVLRTVYWTYHFPAGDVTTQDAWKELSQYKDSGVQLITDLALPIDAEAPRDKMRMCLWITIGAPLGLWAVHVAFWAATYKMLSFKYAEFEKVARAQMILNNS